MEGDAEVWSSDLATPAVHFVSATVKEQVEEEDEEAAEVVA